MKTGNDKAKIKAAADKIKLKYKAKQLNALNSDDPEEFIKELLEQIKIKDKAIAYLEASDLKKDAEILRLNAIINDLTKEKSDDPTVTYKGYSEEWAYIEKVCFIVERSKQALTAREIIDEILVLEPKLKKRLNDPYNSFTQAIHHGVKLERLIKWRKKGTHGHTYLINPVFSYPFNTGD